MATRRWADHLLLTAAGVALVGALLTFLLAEPGVGLASLLASGAALAIAMVLAAADWAPEERKEGPMSSPVGSRVPARILMAVFPNPGQLDRARQALEGVGVPSDFLGLRIASEEDGLLPALTVNVPTSLRAQVEEILAGRALQYGPPAAMRDYGPPPHPGIFEDHDMKLPMAREFPATLSEPRVVGDRVPGHELDPEERVRHFGELELGYSEEEALLEASRCLVCPTPHCMEGCPAGNDIGAMIRGLRAGDYAAAVAALRRTSTLPAICSRVCDYARQCEGSCILGREGGQPVAIHSLERFVADWEREHVPPGQRMAGRRPPTGKRVAIVGAGPAGLAAAEVLLWAGHAVTVYEAMPVAGGALAWGIPSFRLPPSVLEHDLRALREAGVQFRFGAKIGEDISVAGLLSEGCDALFVATGTPVPATPGIPGEDLQGVYTAHEFLARAKLSLQTEGAVGPPAEIGSSLVVAVVGAGNTAMDVAQTAVRLGARDVLTMDILSEAEVPARSDEIEGARAEGVRFSFQTMPVRLLGDRSGRVQAVECVAVDWSAPDPYGRRHPAPREGSEFTVEADTVVIAIGSRPAGAQVLRGTDGVHVDPRGYVGADAATGATSHPRVWAGGDAVTAASAPGTVVAAMAMGRRVGRDVAMALQA